MPGTNGRKVQMDGVLSQLKVLDLSRGIAGPMATMLLADHGARVTRIEPEKLDPPPLEAGVGKQQGTERAAAQAGHPAGHSASDGSR